VRQRTTISDVLSSGWTVSSTADPGPTQTGWIDDDLAKEITGATPLGRLGRPLDCANLVAFLCSPEGGWINGQLIYSDGGISAAG